MTSRIREPKSIREMVRDPSIRAELGIEGASGHSGQAHAELSKLLETALRSFYENAVSMFGEEQAACTLAHLIAKDPAFSRDCPAWIKEALAPHRAAIAAAFARESKAVEPAAPPGGDGIKAAKKRAARARKGKAA